MKIQKTFFRMKQTYFIDGIMEMDYKYTVHIQWLIEKKKIVRIIQKF
jgi:hypothetical protein